MRRTYLFCDKCGVGHAHLLPRHDKYSLTNAWSWDAIQYAKNRRVLCPPCKLKIIKK